jgi:hypothetical protein
VIYLRIFDPETWVLGQRFEVTVNKNTTMNDLANMVEKLYPDLLAANM